MTKISKCLCGSKAKVKFGDTSDGLDLHSARTVYVECTECKRRTEGSFINKSWVDEAKNEAIKDEILEWNDYMEPKQGSEAPKNPSKYYLTPEEFFDGPDIIYVGGPFTGYYRKYNDPDIACDQAYAKNADLWTFRIAAVVIIVSLLFLWWNS